MQEKLIFAVVAVAAFLGLWVAFGFGWALMIVGAVMIVYDWMINQGSQVPVHSQPSAAERKRQIAEDAMETLDKIDPPLTGEDYAVALRKLCRAVEQGRPAVEIKTRDRQININIV